MEGRGRSGGGGLGGLVVVMVVRRGREGASEEFVIGDRRASNHGATCYTSNGSCCVPRNRKGLPVGVLRTNWLRPACKTSSQAPGWWVHKPVGKRQQQRALDGRYFAAPSECVPDPLGQ